MKKIIAIIFVIIIIVWWVFYKIQNDKQLELEKQQQIEYEKKKEEERQAYIEKRVEENKKRKEEFLNSLTASELSTYEKNYYPDYMIVFYKNDKVYQRIFTNNYPKKKYLNGECIEYSDIRVKKRNAEKEFCPDENQYYKVVNLDFNSL